MELLLFIVKTFVYYWQTNRLDMMVNFEVPCLTVLFLAAVWIFCRRRKRHGGKLFVIFYTLITLIMFADAAYSSYFGRYVSVNQLFQLGSLGSIAEDGNVIGAAVNISCVLTLLDYPLAIWWYRYSLRKKKSLGFLCGNIVQTFVKKENIRTFAKKYRNRITFAGALGVYLVTAIAFIYYGWNVTEDRYVQKINHIEFFTYHTNDLIVNIGGRIRRETVDKQAIQEQMKAVVPTSEGDRYRGIAKGKNLILIQLESVNDFVIGAKYRGEELTPNLNRLLQEDTLYFDRFYSTTGVGNTSDAEFAALNSLYGNEQRECYRLYVDNTFDGLPWMLRREGYETMAFHGYVKTFWNREEAYKNQGIEEYYSQERLETTEVSGFGITDKEMFRQAVDILQTKQEPFFSFMITLTNHIPYDMPQNLASLKLASWHENTMFGRYLQTIRYTDEAIGVLIEELKEAGLYEDTMIVMYGDHQGMNKETPEVRKHMSSFLGKEYDFDEMLKVPFIVHIPGSGIRETVTTVGGQVDIMPTIANLMDMPIAQPYIFGHDLLNTKEGFVAQISYIGKGSYIDGNNEMMYAIGKDGTILNGRVLHIPDGTAMNVNHKLCEEQSNRAISILDLCKEVLDYNLIADYVTH